MKKIKKYEGVVPKESNEAIQHNAQKIRAISAKALESSRNHDFGYVMVDIAKRDVAGGNYNIDIVIYKNPEIPQAKLEPFIQATCQRVFRTRKGIDLVWRDEAKIGREVLGGKRVCEFDNWCITVEHPRSILYSVGRLEAIFLNEFNKVLGR